MSANYNSKKKPELEALLKERGLSHTGNKPDLIARLEEDDQKKAGADSGAAVPAQTAEEDQIDWNDDAADSNLEAAQAAETPASKVALEAGGIGRVSNPVDVPNQVVDEANDPGRTEDTVVHQPAATEAGDAAASAEAKKQANEEKFKADLKTSEADAEAEKRRKRAERFSITVPEPVEASEEEQKKKERAEKFGTAAEGDAADKPAGENFADQKLISRLDGALPERKERKRGRDRGDVGRHGVHKRVDSRRRDHRPRGPDNRSRGQDNRPRGPPRGGMSDADRAAADARKARFAAS